MVRSDKMIREERYDVMRHIPSLDTVVIPSVDSVSALGSHDVIK